jgi:hypothetical protein
MPALAEFLKGTVNDSLTKILQPAGLIPGALFVLLNVGFVLPRAKTEKVGVATSYAELDGTWQVVVAAALVLAIGFLLLSASGSVLDTLAGRTWRTSIFGVFLRWVRKKRRNKLANRIAQVNDFGSGADIERLDELLWRQRTRTAPAGRLPAATALGDVLLAAEHGIKERYGLSVAALWEPLRASQKSDDPATTAAAESKATLDLMGNLTFVLVAFTLEAIVVYTLFDDPRAVLLALLGLPVAYVAYRVTVAKGISWCDAIDTAVALHAHELLGSLGIRKATGGADRRALLEQASDFMLRDVPDNELFGVAPAAGPGIITSADLTAAVHERATRSPATEVEPAGAHRASIAFDVFVNRAKTQTAWTTTGTLLFEDTRLPRLRAMPPGAEELALGVDATTCDALRWSVTVAGGSTTTLSFELDRWRVAVDGDLTVTVELLTGEATRFVTVSNATGAVVSGAVLRIFHTEDGVTHVVEPGAGLAPAVPPMDGHERRFTLPSMAVGATHLAVYALVEVD